MASPQVRQKILEQLVRTADIVAAITGLTCTMGQPTGWRLPKITRSKLAWPGETTDTTGIEIRIRWRGWLHYFTIGGRHPHQTAPAAHGVIAGAAHEQNLWTQDWTQR